MFKGAGKVVCAAESEFCGDLGDRHRCLEQIYGGLVDLEVVEIFDRCHRCLSDELAVQVRGVVAGVAGDFVDGEFSVDVFIHEVRNPVDDSLDVTGLFAYRFEQREEPKRGDQMGECEICIVQTIESHGAAEDTVEVFEQLDALFDPHVNRRGHRDGSLHVSCEDFSLLAVEFYPVDAPWIVVFCTVGKGDLFGKYDVLVGLDRNRLLSDADRSAAPDAINKEIGVVARRSFDEMVTAMGNVP